MGRICFLLRNLGKEEGLKEPLFSQPSFEAVKEKKKKKSQQPSFSEIYIPRYLRPAQMISHNLLLKLKVSWIFQSFPSKYNCTNIFYICICNIQIYTFIYTQISPELSISANKIFLLIIHIFLLLSR